MRIGLAIFFLLGSCACPDLGFDGYFCSSSNYKVGLSNASEEDSIAIDVKPRATRMCVTVDLSGSEGELDWTLYHGDTELWRGNRASGSAEQELNIPARTGHWSLKWKMSDYSGNLSMALHAVGR